jgi:hypothetical protein
MAHCATPHTGPDDLRYLRRSPSRMAYIPHHLNMAGLHARICYTQRCLDVCPPAGRSSGNLPESSNLAGRVGACVSAPLRCSWATIASPWRWTFKENYGAAGTLATIGYPAASARSCVAARHCYGRCLKHPSPAAANSVVSPSDSKSSRERRATTPTQ